MEIQMKIYETTEKLIYLLVHNRESVGVLQDRISVQI